MQKSKFNAGALLDAFQSVHRHFDEGIYAETHAQSYVGAHPNSFAESEFTGKFLDICARFYAAEGDEIAYRKGTQVVESIAENQREDGYLGGLAPGNETQAFSVWNQGFTLYGLVSFYRATGDEKVLRLAKRAADWICSAFFTENAPDILDAGNGGSQHISCLYAMGAIYAETHETRYADFLHKLITHCEKTEMNLLSFENILDLMSRKGIEMLVVYLGVLQYGRLFGDARAISAAQRYWQQIADTQIRNTGNATIREVWTENGNAARLMPTEDKPNETCVAVGWMELSAALFFENPQAKYLDAIEKTLFNHLLGSLSKTGDDFAYYQGNFGRKIFRTPGGMYQCCRYRGYTFVSYLKDLLFHFAGNTLTPMVYANAGFETEHLRAEIRTEYPADGKIRITAESDLPGAAMRLRIPAWCNAFSLRVNGFSSNSAPENGFVTVPLAQGTSEIELCLQMPLRKAEHEIAGKRYVSYEKGPLLLAKTCAREADLWLPLSGEPTPADPANSLVRFAAGDIILKDFASAGLDGEELYTVFIPE